MFHLLEIILPFDLSQPTVPWSLTHFRNKNLAFHSFVFSPENLSNNAHGKLQLGQRQRVT